MHNTDRNNGEVTGNKDRVVGYTAVGSYAPAPERLTAAERTFLIGGELRILVTAAGSINR